MVTVFDLRFDDRRLPYLVTEREVEYNGRAIRSSNKAAEAINKVFDACNLLEEHLFMVCMTAANDITAVFDVSHGGTTAALANVGAACKRALISGAVNVIIGHNHPSGELTPSASDDDVCERYQKALDLIDIKLLDFIIVGGNEEQFLSYSECGIM